MRNLLLWWLRRVAALAALVAVVVSLVAAVWLRYDVAVPAAVFAGMAVATWVGAHRARSARI